LPHAAPKPINIQLSALAVRLGLIPDSLFGTGRHAAENVSFMHALEAVSLSIPKWCHRWIDGKQINATFTLGDAIKYENKENYHPCEQLQGRL